MKKEKKNLILNIVLGMMIAYVVIFGSAFILKSLNIKAKYYQSDYYLRNEESMYDRKDYYLSYVDSLINKVETEDEKLCLEAIKDSIEKNESVNDYYDPFSETQSKPELLSFTAEKYKPCNFSKQTVRVLENMVGEQGLQYDKLIDPLYNMYILQFDPLRDTDLEFDKGVSAIVLARYIDQYVDDAEILFTGDIYRTILVGLGEKYGEK